MPIQLHEESGGKVLHVSGISAKADNEHFVLVCRVSGSKVIQCNVRDKTDRKRSEARFGRLVDSNAQGGTPS